MSDKLTPPQTAVLVFLESREAAGDGPPSLREICDEFGYTSTKAAFDHLRALENKGWIKRDPKRARSIRLLRCRRGLALLGNIAAGQPHDTAGANATSADTRLPIDAKLFGVRRPENAYVLRVTGDSMTGRNLVDGDWVIVEHGASPKDRDIVAALIDNETTLKTFVLQGKHARLKAENPAYSDPEPTWGFEIQGVVRGVVRRMAS